VRGQQRKARSGIIMLLGQRFIIDLIHANRGFQPV